WRRAETHLAQVRRRQEQVERALERLIKDGDAFVELSKHPPNGQDSQRWRDVLLGRARSLFKHSALLFGDDPSVRHKVAALTHRASGLTEAQGSRQEALAAWQEVAARDEALVREDPHNRKLRTWLSRSYHRVGSIAAQLGRPSEALTHYQRSAAVWEGL